MFKLQILCICLLVNITNLINAEEEEAVDVLATVNDFSEEPPTVLITLLVRNKAHTLPYFLTNLERLNYPKDRISLWIRSDHNEDNSLDLLQLWLNKTATMYHNVDFKYDNESQNYLNESSAFDWPTARFLHLIHLKEQALTHAQKIWADYIFYLDVDVLLTYPDTLLYLTKLRLPIVAPMLLSEGLYSNFWCGMTYDYYYLRTDEYKEIYDVRKVGNFKVPMVHSAVLVHLNNVLSRYLTFDRTRLVEQQLNDVEWATVQGLQCRPYDGPVDDIIIFAISANCSQIPIFVNNEYLYGYILQPLEKSDTLGQDMQQLMNIKTNIIHDLGKALEVDEVFSPYISYPEKHKLTLDRIYMINLERRPERRHKMELLFKELGLDVQYFQAVDGKTLDHTIIKEMGITFLKGYEDPFHHRQMTMGEVGCFLSHYGIWEEIVEQGLKEVLILEDDIRFEPYFNERAVKILEEARNAVEYDLIYFGRKRLKEETEPWVAGTEYLVHVGYSYWTLGYVISLQGARKLINAKPLEKLIPVDEYLPVMFNRHPNKTWASAYSERNLIAFSAAPLILFPTHYTGDMGYISDTEDSELTTEKLYSAQSAQLKSDREQQFYVGDSTKTKCKKECGLNDFINLSKVDKYLQYDLNVANQHDEF